jgi:hypothetical protein
VNGVRIGRHRGIPRHSRRCTFDQTDLAGAHRALALDVRCFRRRRSTTMSDPKNGKGGFQLFANRENGTADKAVPLAASQAVNPAPIVGTPALKPDIGPVLLADKKLPNTLGDSKPTVRK